MHAKNAIPGRSSLKDTVRIVLLHKHLLLSLLNLLDNLPLTIVFETASRNLVQSQDLLIRVLDQDILALWSLETHISNRTNNTPAVGEREVHLGSKVARLPAYDAEDNVAVVGLGVGTGDESDFMVSIGTLL